MRAGDRLSSPLLKTIVSGLNLAPDGPTLAHQLGARPVVLYFLRHFG